VLCIVLLTTCKTAKSGLATGAETETAIVKSEEALFVSVLNNSLKFSTLSAQLKFDYKAGEKSLSTKAQIKMIADEQVLLSVQLFLGIEAFRILMTADSVSVLDRINRRYMTDSYEHLKGETRLDFTLQNLQALLTNRIFLPGSNHATANSYKRFTAVANSRTAVYSVHDDIDLDYSFIADINERLLSTRIENKDKQHSLLWLYDKFDSIDGQSFPTEMNVKVTIDETASINATLHFTHTEINVPVKTDFTVPSGYQHVTASQLFKSL
jgi:hypothetical protein